MQLIFFKKKHIIALLMITYVKNGFDALPLTWPKANMVGRRRNIQVILFN